jgi:thioredoxin-related protein
MRYKNLSSVVCLIAIITLSGCTNRPKEPEKRTFPVVTIPAIYTAQQARAEFLVMHYWDQFDFSDTTWVGSSELITEQALVDYLSILPYANYNVIYNGIIHLLNQADKNMAMYAFFSSKMEFYLSNTNSTLRNDEFFIPVLEHMVASKSLDQPRKVRPNAILPVLNKNRPGTQAADIHYTMVSGVKNSLYNLKSDFFLMVFYDFDCEDCNKLKSLIEESTVIKEMQKQKKLTILAIYPGANMEGWKKSLSQIPASWINGYDHDEEIGKDGTYVFRTIPTIFLLDKNHKVIMKEPSFNYVEIYLNNLLNPQVNLSGSTGN